MLYVFEEWTLDTEQYVLYKADLSIQLQSKVFQVLQYLLTHRDRVIAKQELCEQIWPDQFISDATVESAIKAIRRAVSDDGRTQWCIQTRRGLGYRFVASLKEPTEAPSDTETAARASRSSREASSPQAPILPSRDLPTVSRRQLTVMFCDLVDSTALSGQFDPEDLRDLIQAYHQVCAEVAHRYDGYIVQDLGDGLLVYFGYPQADEDDAQRAVRTGLGILTAIGRLSTQLEATHGVRLPIRIGIYTCLVGVGGANEDGPQDQLAFGEAPNIAAQLQRLARPNQVVLSEETRRLAGGEFAYTDLGVKTLKGVNAPLRVCRVEGERQHASRFDGEQGSASGSQIVLGTRNSGMERKLAAIFSADVQGYSRLMGDDEAATIRTLTTYREVLSDLIAQHQGRVVDSPGDTLLAEFASVVQAVQCAVAVQRDLARRNADLPAHRVMAFRIGINLGDVIAEDDRLYGDGVNIAARLEGLAEGGGICISGTAYDQVETKLELAYDDLGEQRVKNITRPVRVYRVWMDTEVEGPTSNALPAKAKRWRRPVAAGAAIVIMGVISILLWRTTSRSPTPTPAGTPTATIPVTPPDKPSIAVLPFANISGDAEQAYFADGMTDDLITDLSKLSGLFVIARHSVFSYKGQAVTIPQVAEELGVRYVIEGSVRRAGETVRINAQLIDATSGGHLWAETFDRPYQDVFAVQDEVTDRIVRALQVKLTATEQAQLGHRPTASLEAYERFLQAEELYHNDLNSDTVKKALALYEQAVSRDPEFAEAQAGIAFMTYIVARMGARRILPPAVALERSDQALARALALNPHLPKALSLQSLRSLWTGRFDEAVELGATAVANGPNNAVVRSRFATALVHAGRHEEATAAVETTLRLAPHPSVRTLSHIGMTLYHLRQYKRAIVVLQPVQEAAPSSFSLSLSALVASYAQLDRMGEAQSVLTHVKQFLRLPSLNLAYYRSVARFKHDADLDHYLDGLRKAGVPEWPFGFVPVEEHRLTGDEIKAQVMGRAQVGTNLKGRPHTVTPTADGKVVYQTPDVQLTFTSTVEGDALCLHSPAILLGRKFCHAIYRNPDGSREDQNEYISVGILTVNYFSVQP